MNVSATFVRSGCWILVLGTTLLLGAVWLTPLEVIQSQVLERAGDDLYARFEASGRAEALTWLLRIAAPLGLLLFWPSRRRAERISGWTNLAIEGFSRATRPEADDSTTTSSVETRTRTWLLQGCCLVWGGLAITHLVAAVDQRARDWSWYRLNTGLTVLPNISESNRMVIRYLRQATPEDARILILSDQKLFFIAYYLLPRRVYHPMHPDAEYVIPRAHQERPLAAYQLADLDAEYLDEVDADYLAEYFEGPAYVDADQLMSDPDWVAFYREWRRDADVVPSFHFALHRRGPEGHAP